MSYYFTVEIEVEVPDWATFIAVDKSGEAWFYETKPWCSVGAGRTAWVNLGGRYELAYKGQTKAFWQKEIYEIWRKD